MGLHCDMRGKLIVLTLDRPERANALGAALLEAVIAAVDRAAAAVARDEVRALVLTGAGRVFSAGADLDEARSGLAASPLWEALSSRIAALPCLTIAALNGTVAGGAFGMVLACDLRIAVPEAQFFYPVMKMGFLPPAPDPGRMAQLIGPSRTRLMLLGGARIGAEEAERWGLIDRIVSGERLQDEARALAAPALAAAPGQVAGIKRLIP